MFQKFNPAGGSFEQKKYQGDWTCSECGAKITELPFEPTPGRGVSCRDCHSKKRQSFGDR